MPLTYLPDRRCFFLWNEEHPHPAVTAAANVGKRGRPELVTPQRRARVAGMTLPLLAAVERLATIPASDLPAQSASVATWSLASKLALDLVCRERVVPTIVSRGAGAFARWRTALASTEDAARVSALADFMPPAAHAVPALPGRSRKIWAPEALLRTFLDAAADALIRRAGEEVRTADEGHPGQSAVAVTAWVNRWRAALTTDDAAFEIDGFAERTLLDDLEMWSAPALGGGDRLRALFRLELPKEKGDPFVLRFLLQSPDDPSLQVTAAQVWCTQGRTLAKLGRAFRDPQESLIEALGRAARLFPPLADCLTERAPKQVELEADAAWQFLETGAQALSDAGFGVALPAELTSAGQRRLKARMRVGKGVSAAGAVSGAAGLDLDALLSFKWEAALGDKAISAKELKALAAYKSPLVRHRGQWVVIDPTELADIRERLAEKPGQMPARTAVAAALAGELRQNGVPVAVRADDQLARLLDDLCKGAERRAKAPAGFAGKLRPYQARGLAWLKTMAQLGFGACLADDMGLGKTIQLLALLLSDLGRVKQGAGAVLLVAPTSVLGNWEHEARRFAPALEVVHHYGPDRARKADELPRRADTLVITSYGLLRRDIKLLAQVSWRTVILDEAQNIKNASSATARAARALLASQRFALTGTPVENRLAELWSIFEFANPGLLGSLERFRREYAVPIERYGDDESAKRLRGIVGPFLLRRLKSDPKVIRDLPPKNEMKVICTLTREQASLYQALVDEEIHNIEDAEGIARRGRVLALLTALKQICNHPAQYLGDAGPLARRSGKLDRIREMLNETLAEGDKALVFTQYREMGSRLVEHFEERFGVEVAFLHGGTSRKSREEMVRRFQDEPYGPRIFVLSLKAGGTGLNLTAATHVFHFDRWWNPAVEDQATDRAYRIGQKRSVQVHKLICAGTVEDKVDAMLEKKRNLAAKVVGSGEQWITELGNAELRELFALSPDATVDTDERGARNNRATRRKTRATKAPTRRTRR